MLSSLLSFGNSELLSLSSFIDLHHPQNLHWLAVLASSVMLSLTSSLVPNYVETALDMRSHNRARLFNETSARLHIAYIIFLLTLITSDDIDKTGNTIIGLDTLIIILVFILIWSIIVSGRTLERIRKSFDMNGAVHHCIIVKGICHVPVGWWIGCKVCFTNALTAFVVGIICLGLAVNPSLIKHDQLGSSSQLPKGQQKDYYDTLRGTYDRIAHQTKEQFEENVMGIREEKYKDDKLNVSYWFSYDGVVRQLGTTHAASAEDTYKVDEGSIIGCGFFYQNSSVRWDDESNQAVVWPYYAAPQPRDSCK